MNCQSNSRPILLIILTLAVAMACSAQDDNDTEDVLLGPALLHDAEDSVADAVHSLFDAMRAADSAAVRDAFLPNATLQSVSLKEDSEAEYSLSESPINAFAQAVGGEHPVFDEQISDLQIHVDAGLATAWMDYEFYLGDELSHCGVNAFQYVLTDAGWKILHVTDTRRKQCE